jgi:hypothetical protein
MADDCNSPDRPHQATIHPDILAGDVAGPIRHQESDRRRNFLACAVSLHRHSCPPFFGSGQAVDPARQHIVHAHIVGGILVRKQFCVGGKTRPGHGRCWKHGARLGYPGSRDIDDRAALLSDEDRRNEPDRPRNIEEIDVQRRMPLLVRDVEQRRRGPWPALLTSASTRPHFFMVSSTRRLRSSFDWFEPVTPSPPSSAAKASPLPDEDRMATR